MKDYSPDKPTFTDAINRMEALGTPSQKQDIRKSRTVFHVNGIEGPDLDAFPADLKIFDEQVPKLSGTKPTLQRLIMASGISDETYKQSWRAARRVIEAYTGEGQERKERKSRQDEWATFLDLFDTLAAVGLLNKNLRISLSKVIDVSRAADITPAALDAKKAASLLSTSSGHARRTIKKGLKALDKLKDVPRLGSMLSKETLTPKPKPASRIDNLPQNNQQAIKRWLDVAAREQMEDERYEHLAVELSPATRACYSAALSLYVATLLEANEEASTELANLFSNENVDAVMAAWKISKNQGRRTQHDYTINLAVVLVRNGHPDQAAYLYGMIATMSFLAEGRAASKIMTPKVKKWCEDLLSDPKKKALFQTQHIEYLERAVAVLKEAQTEGLDLKSLTTTKAINALPKKKAKFARKALRKARMFGMMAAYTAIALEGAPYRRENMLTARHSGPNKTMFLHLAGPSPHLIIKFPNSELKNGIWLSERGEELEAVIIKKRGAGDFGSDIISFYLREIRPLFPEADKTHCFFPPLEKAKTTETGFVKGTFYDWLAEASAAIGLPMNSHNFRHGYCSIDINEGQRSMEDLAKILGDTVAVIQKNYAWINSRQSVVNVQRSAADRRANLMKNRRT